MEHIYTVHTKQIQDKTYYFVKKIMTLPEIKGLADVVIGFGMHTHFEKACSIAGIYDSTTRKKLLHELEKQNLNCLPERFSAKQSVMPKKLRVIRSIQIIDTVNRWLAERSAAALN